MIPYPVLLPLPADWCGQLGVKVDRSLNSCLFFTSITFAIKSEMISLINVARGLPATGWSDRQSTGEVPLSSQRTQELVCSWRRRTCKAVA